MALRSILILIAVCIVMIWLTNFGYNSSFDDYNYVLYAHQILNGTFSILQSPYAYGYLLPYTVAGVLSLGLSASVPAMLEYIILILLIYAIARKLSNDKIAFAVGIIAATSAFICAYSARVLPDMLVGDIVALATWFIIANQDVPTISALLSGLVTGLLIFVKLGSLVISIPIAITLALGRHKQQVPIYLFGVIVVALFYFSTIGFNFSIIESYQAEQLHLDVTNFWINGATALVYITPILFFLQQGSFWQIYPLGLLFDFALIGGYIAFLKKERFYLQWFLVLLIGFLYLEFGSESLTTYQPIVVVARYFVILSPMMAILTTRFLQGVYDFTYYRYKLTTANIILACLVLCAILFQIPMVNYFHLGAPHFVGAPLQS